MRLLHTSDWHLGRSLHGAPMLEAQRTFLLWLRDLARERGVDAVLVSGDIYDRAVPSTDAVALLDESLAAFAEAGIPVVLTSGNHDSAVRLGFGGDLARAAGIHLRTRVADLSTPVVLTDDAGPVAVYGIPYLLPDAVMEELGADRSHAGVLRAAVERILADAAARGITRTVALAHAFVTGGAASESERDIRVGGIGDAPATVFDGLTYTALGHLHGRQSPAELVHYCGSPLAFSFSERSHEKSVTIVDVDAAGRVSLGFEPTPVPRRLVEVRGRLEDLLLRAGSDLADLADAWVKVLLTDASRPHAPMERLRERWPHTLVLDFQPEGRVEDAAHLAVVRDTTEPVEICAAFVEWVDSTRPDAAHRDVLEAAVAAAIRAELSA